MDTTLELGLLRPLDMHRRQELHVCVLLKMLHFFRPRHGPVPFAFMYATLQHYLLPPYGQLGGLDLLCKSVSTYCLPIRCPPQMYTEQPHLCAYAGQGHMIPASCLE